jgi:hypothetical protein
MDEKTPSTPDEKTPSTPSEVEAERERKAIRKAIDETEAPTRVEVKQPPKPKTPAPDEDRQPAKFPPTGSPKS